MAESIFGQICHILDIEREVDETADEFKIRAVKGFNDFTESDYAELPESVKLWLFGAAKEHRANLTRKKPRALPGLPGLDIGLRRVDITKPAEPKARGRKRIPGQDAVTRVMILLLDAKDPEVISLDELKEGLMKRFSASYGDNAIKQARHAFLTARKLILGEEVETENVAAE